MSGHLSRRPKKKAIAVPKASAEQGDTSAPPAKATMASKDKVAHKRGLKAAPAGETNDSFTNKNTGQTMRRSARLALSAEGHTAGTTPTDGMTAEIGLDAIAEAAHPPPICQCFQRQHKMLTTAVITKEAEKPKTIKAGRIRGGTATLPCNDAGNPDLHEHETVSCTY